jgi:uncharacterized protein (DUF305 family)
MHKRVLALPAAALTALLVSGCGSDDTPAAAPTPSGTSLPSASASAGVSAEHNDADVMFAQMMIPHHRQAIGMAKMAPTRATDPQVKELAATIRAAQDPEIQTMASWLTAWASRCPQGCRAWITAAWTTAAGPCRG